MFPLGGSSTSEYPLTTPPLAVVTEEEPENHVLAVKGAFHDYVIPWCTFGKKGTEH